MSTYTIDTATSRATPSPAPMKRLTVPALRDRKGKEPIVALTAYTMRMAQLLDPHCDILLVGDSLGQVIYGLPTTVPVTVEYSITPLGMTLAKAVDPLRHWAETHLKEVQASQRRYDGTQKDAA